MWRTLIIIFWFPDLLSMEGAYFTDGKFSCIFFFVYTFCRLLCFRQNLDMTFQGFHNIQSGHNITAELFKYGLFWKLSKNFGFHRNQCKMPIIYGNATREWCTLFQNQTHLFTGHAQFFHLMLVLLAKIVFYRVQKQKGKHVFGKIEIIRVCHIVSSVAQQRNPVDFSNSSCK